ncbi:MAG: M56 family metallopeptidase [Actinomycetota bacterium]|nr:M56 family metallopeptidase [Actinomycetota bacterium]
MPSHSPTFLALETDSAWVVIVVVSIVSFIGAIGLRRVINRTGGVASGILLAMPLLLPMVAAVLFPHPLLPEIAVLRPAGEALLDHSDHLLNLLLLTTGHQRVVTPYALTASAGSWILIIGLSISSFMLLRRIVGAILVHRLVSRCQPLTDEAAGATAMVKRLARAANLRPAPEVLRLPDGVSGAFAVGARRRRILISQDLLDNFDEDELEAILAHEIAHLEARDVQVIFSAGMLRDAVGWNPVAHLAFRRLLADRELEADRRAAALTGAPLAVASGLLKMCDLVGKRPRLRHRIAVGFLRPGGRITRRVSHLIALADGNAVARQDGRIPYLLAGALVAILSLQVGARIAQQDSSAFAIVWGAPHTAVGALFQPPRKSAILQTERARTPVARKLSGRAQLVYRQLTHEVSLRREDFGPWLAAMVQFRASQTGQTPTEIYRDKLQLGWRWQAVPLSPPMGEMSIYRIDRSKLWPSDPANL